MLRIYCGSSMNIGFFFFSSRRRHTRWNCDWSSDVCSSDLLDGLDRLDWLRPDGKSQVSVEYEGDRPVAVRTVVVSTQHAERNGSRQLAHRTIKEAVIEEVIQPVLESAGLEPHRTKFLINPTGRFVIGGPHGDAGLTGRKIIVDTYGGMARHGGGAFSGKDPSKVDRSAAYAARWV